MSSSARIVAPGALPCPADGDLEAQRGAAIAGQVELVLGAGRAQRLLEQRGGRAALAVVGVAADAHAQAAAAAQVEAQAAAPGRLDVVNDGCPRGQVERGGAAGVAGSDGVGAPLRAGGPATMTARGPSSTRWIAAVGWPAGDEREKCTRRRFSPGFTAAAGSEKVRRSQGLADLQVRERLLVPQHGHALAGSHGAEREGHGEAGLAVDARGAARGRGRRRAGARGCRPRR
jgi:hypothetical protein